MTDHRATEDERATAIAEDNELEDIATGDLAEFRVPLPTAIHDAAFHGPIGSWAKSNAGRTTEASATALAIISYSIFSALIGRDRWLRTGGMRIHARVWSLIVGATSRGRKGTAFNVTHEMFTTFEAEEKEIGYGEVTRAMRGFNSGEGIEASLIAAADGNDTISAFAWIGEFASLIARNNRDNSTLGSVMRELFDGRPISRNTVSGRNNGHVQFPHAAIAAAVTPAELRMLTNQTDKDSGVLNRYLTLGVEGTLLDNVTTISDAANLEVGNAIAAAIAWLATTGPHEMRLDPVVEVTYKAWRRDLWNRAASGAVGGMENRAETHVLSLAMTIAALDHRLEIGPRHFMAALAFWALHERTVRAIWAAAPAVGHESRVWEVLRQRGGSDGMTASEIKNRVFSKNNRATADKVLKSLFDSGWIESFYLTDKANRPRLRAVDLRAALGNTEQFIGELADYANNADPLPEDEVPFWEKNGNPH